MKKVNFMYFKPRFGFAIIFFLTSLVQAYAQQASKVEKSYEIFDTKTAKNISFPQMVERLKKYDVVFFGEEHNDSIAHLLQLELYKALSTENSSIVLAMEMFEKDIQLVLNEYLKSVISEKHFKKDARVWNNYSAYKPLIEFAKENNQTIIASNVPGRYANLVNRKGINALETISTESKNWIPKMPLIMSDTAYENKFSAIMGGHDQEGIKNMFAAQTLWDTGMAESIATELKKGAKQILHINGRFHSDGNMGIAFQLNQMMPKIKTVIISSFSIKNEEEKNYRNLGDFVIVTRP